MNDRSSTRPRILFVAEAVTLAHVGRPRVLAESLDPTRYEVHLAADCAFDAALAGFTGQRWPLTSMAPARFLQSLAAGRPLYDAKTLESYVADDLALLERVRPAVVVGDFRLSLAVSAPLMGIPYLALVNAYWSPYADLPFWPIPDLPPVRIFGERFSAALFNRIRPLIFRLHAAALNRVRRRHGLAPVGDLPHAYTWGDETLYLDLPQMVPMRSLPTNHHFLGPVIWEPEVPLPEWWDSLPADRPTLYVTLGSSGPAALLSRLLTALARLPVNVVAATAGRVDRATLPPGVWAADYLPGTAVAARADLVISNGGSPAGYQALSQGTPVLGLPTNLDQHLATGHLVATGAGAALRSERATPAAIQTLVERMLGDPDYAQAARRVRDWIAVARPGEELARRLAARL